VFYPARALTKKEIIEMDTTNVFTMNRVPLSSGVSFSGVTGEQLMVTHLHFEAGAVGAVHTHPHEQLTVVLRGKIEFILGEERKMLQPGDAVAIAGTIRHGVLALTSAEVLDIFTPIREDLAAKLNS